MPQAAATTTSVGMYFDYEKGKLVPNSLKVLKERHEEFLTACQVCEEDFRIVDENPKVWWTQCIVKSKADSLLNHLDNILVNMEVNEAYFARYTAMKACVLYQASEFLIDKYTNASILLLKKAHELLWPLLPISEAYFLYFCSVVNYVELVLRNPDKKDSIIQILEEAIQVNESVVPKVLFTCKDLFSLNYKIQPRKETRDLLEQNVTRIYQLLINLYIFNMDTLKYVRCEHFLLKRELRLNIQNNYDWINRALILSKILITEHDFRNSRHHLAAATYHFHRYIAPSSIPKSDSEKMKLRKVEEVLATTWIKYGLRLVTESKNVILAKYSRGDEPDGLHQSESKEVNNLEVLLERKVSEHSTQLLNQITHNRSKIENDTVDACLKEAASKLNSYERNDIDDSIIDKALLLHPQDTCAEKFTDALRKTYYIDLRFPGEVIEQVERRIPRSIIDSPKEAADILIFILPWIDLFKKLIHTSVSPLKYAESILELNDFFKTIAFFQPDPKQQYELHKERQIELELLAWLLKNEKDQKMIDTELAVTRELSIVHYQLTEMNLNRMKQLEEKSSLLKTKSDQDLITKLLASNA